MGKAARDHLKALLNMGIIGCMTLLLVLLAGFPSFAAKEGKVSTETANVRKEATTDSDRVAQLAQGTSFTVMEEVADGSGMLWYHVLFDLEGEQTAGWLRSDLVSITAENGQGTDPGQGLDPETTSMDAVINGITILEPTYLPELSEDYIRSQVSIGNNTYTCFQVNEELTEYTEIYLVYGTDSSGLESWYYYDASQGTIQRDVGQFQGTGTPGSNALLQAMQNENIELQADMESKIKTREYIIIGVGALALILLIVVIVLAVKLSQVEYLDDDEYADDDYADDYDEDDDYEDDDYDEDGDYDDYEEIDDDGKGGMPAWMIARRREKAKQEKARSEKEKLLTESEDSSKETEEERDEGEILADVLQKEKDQEEEKRIEEIQNEVVQGLKKAIEESKQQKEQEQREQEQKQKPKEKPKFRIQKEKPKSQDEKSEKEDEGDDFGIEFLDLDDL